MTKLSEKTDENHNDTIFELICFIFLILVRGKYFFF